MDVCVVCACCSPRPPRKRALSRSSLRWLSQKWREGRGEEEVRARKDVALIRIEQLYPFPEDELQASLIGIAKSAHIDWVQEEPENMGAWSFMLRKYRKVNLDVISRLESASPATGSPKVHEIRHNKILDLVMSHAKQKVS